MARYIKGKDGKLLGSVGDGKTSAPTPSDLPKPTSATPAEATDPSAHLDHLYEKFAKRLNVTSDVWARRGRRAAVVAATTAIAIGTLTACGNTTPAPEAPTAAVQDGEIPMVSTFMVKTVDGREIPCVWGHVDDTTPAAQGGLSCDWSANTPSTASVTVPPPADGS